MGPTGSGKWSQKQLGPNMSRKDKSGSIRKKISIIFFNEVIVL